MNAQYFSKEQIKAGEFAAFLKVLMDQAYGKGNRYNDIRIHPEDCGAFSIEWVELPWDGAYGGRFVYVEEPQEWGCPIGKLAADCDDFSDKPE